MTRIIIAPLAGLDIAEYGNRDPGSDKMCACFAAPAGLVIALASVGPCRTGQKNDKERGKSGC